MSEEDKKKLWGEDERGMTCPCGKGRIGDKHSGCYEEALMQQKRNQIGYR